MSPQTAFYRLEVSVLLGAALGLAHCFLEPLRRRRPIAADWLLLAAMGWVWLYLDFGVCRGDLRLGNLAGAALGAWLWNWTAGTALSPIFEYFWKMLAAAFALGALPLKKFFRFVKKLFASGEKWVTIIKSRIREALVKSTGAGSRRLTVQPQAIDSEVPKQRRR